METVVTARHDSSPDAAAYGICMTCQAARFARREETMTPGGPEVFGEPTVGGSWLLVCPNGCEQTL